MIDLCRCNCQDAITAEESCNTRLFMNVDNKRGKSPACLQTIALCKNCANCMLIYKNTKCLFSVEFRDNKIPFTGRTWRFKH